MIPSAQKTQPAGSRVFQKKRRKKTQKRKGFGWLTAVAGRAEVLKNPRFSGRKRPAKKPWQAFGGNGLKKTEKGRKRLKKIEKGARCVRYVGQGSSYYKKKAEKSQTGLGRLLAVRNKNKNKSLCDNHISMRRYEELKVLSTLNRSWKKRRGTLFSPLV